MKNKSSCIKNWFRYTANGKILPIISILTIICIFLFLCVFVAEEAYKNEIQATCFVNSVNSSQIAEYTYHIEWNVTINQVNQGYIDINSTSIRGIKNWLILFPLHTSHDCYYYRTLDVLYWQPTFRFIFGGLLSVWILFTVIDVFLILNYITFCIYKREKSDFK